MVDAPTNLNNPASVYDELEKGVYAALETYSNVHRGLGHFSMASTHLYEQAREIVLKYLGLQIEKYQVVFANPLRATELISVIEGKHYKLISSEEIGLPLGIVALAVRHSAIPKGIPKQTGGGTAKLISQEWIIWAQSPDKFEAGTPPIINVITFARALLMVEKYGRAVFLDEKNKAFTTPEILFQDSMENLSGYELLNELRKQSIGSHVMVPTDKGLVPFINFDNSASTPTFRSIWDVFRKTLRQNNDIKDQMIQSAEQTARDYLGASQDVYDLIFTCNTTEAINLAAKNYSMQNQADFEPVVLNTLMEHTSNELPWRVLDNNNLIHLSVDSEGFIDLQYLKKLLSSYNQDGSYGNKRIKLVAMTGASNVLGSCNDLHEISKIVHRYGAHLLVDAAQLVAHRRIDMDELGIDFLAFSAHKIYAPFGSGLLVARKGLLKIGAAELNQIKESGQQNMAGIAALTKALQLLNRIGLDEVEEAERELTTFLLNELSKVEGIHIYGINDPENPRFENKLGVVVLAYRKIMADSLAKYLAQQGGIGIRAGCHCAHVIVKQILSVSPGLERFQRIFQTLFPKINLPGVARVSLGLQNSREEIDILISTLKNLKPENQKMVKKQISDFVSLRSEMVYSI